jgi:hypothetical protein
MEHISIIERELNQSTSILGAATNLPTASDIVWDDMSDMSLFWRLARTRVSRTTCAFVCGGVFTFACAIATVVAG